MSREIDPRFPPVRTRVNTDRQRWVVISNLPADKQQSFWQKVKRDYPDIVSMRRAGGSLVSKLGEVSGIPVNAVFQIPEERYKQIMGIQ